MKNYLFVFFAAVFLSSFTSLSFAMDSPIFCLGSCVDVKVNDDSAGSCQHWTRFNGQQIAVRGDTVYLVWTDNRNGNFDIWFSRSTDRGATWGQNVRVDHPPANDTAKQWYPAIAVDYRGYIYVIWTDGRPNNTYTNIFFSKSTNGGQSFSSDVKVSDSNYSLAGGDFQRASIAIDNEHHYVFVVWVSKEGSSLYLRCSRSLDDGVSFDSSHYASWGLTNKANPYIVFDQKNLILYTFYASTGTGSVYSYIYCTKSTDSGYSFQLPVLVGEDPSGSTKSSPTADIDTCGNLYVAWRDYRNLKWEIFFSKSIDSGDSFLFANININIDNPTPGITGHIDPTLRTFGCEKICVLWTSTSNSSDSTDIWADMSVNGGISWGTDFRMNNYTLNNQYLPTAAINQEGDLFLAWTEDRKRWNYPDIYSKWFHFDSVYVSKIGDANSDCKVSVSDCVYLINYLFKGGPPPCLLKLGDPNGDCKVSVSDVVYLINYLFKGGPPPLPWCA